MRIGLVLSGGMAKGAYQVGVLKAISEYILPQNFSYISSSSVGVLNSYAFVAGTLDKAEDTWKPYVTTIKGCLLANCLEAVFYRKTSETFITKAISLNFRSFVH